MPSLRDRLDELEALIGASIDRASPVAGGDINEAYRVVLSGGDEVFVKTHAQPQPGMYAAERFGLEWLREASALRIPEVIAASERFLVLEYLAPGSRRPDYDETLGRGLAELHRCRPERFGIDEPDAPRQGFIGSLAQSLTPHDRWHDFYRDQRLTPQVELAYDAGRLNASDLSAFERLLERLETLIGIDEPPARLHGDLWSGNVYCAEDGHPYLIDPAVYGGHREIDLAMMRLFGGFSPRVFEAYHAAYPLAVGHEERVALYQLYPLLVHVNLFGGSYMGQVRRALLGLS